MRLDLTDLVRHSRAPERAAQNRQIMLLNVTLVRPNGNTTDIDAGRVLGDQTMVRHKANPDTWESLENFSRIYN